MEDAEHERQAVRNPYVGHEDYHCFGCDPDNASGLQLQFVRKGDELHSEWEPRTLHEGYPGVIHGGIQASLADEIGGWFLHVMQGTAGMTRDLRISYHRPARSDAGPFRIVARAGERDGRNQDIEVSIQAADGTLLSTAVCTYAVFSEELARKRLSFPGREAFVEREPGT